VPGAYHGSFRPLSRRYRRRDSTTTAPAASVAVASVSEGAAMFKVVVNHEEQYSIWPADRDNPTGWSDEGTAGTRAECLAHIEAVWTDMRPRSLREHMAAQVTR
jgi:MbtH protein